MLWILILGDLRNFGYLSFLFIFWFVSTFLRSLFVLILRCNTIFLMEGPSWALWFRRQLIAVMVIRLWSPCARKTTESYSPPRGLANKWGNPLGKTGCPCRYQYTLSVIDGQHWLWTWWSITRPSYGNAQNQQTEKLGRNKFILFLWGVFSSA